MYDLNNLDSDGFAVSQQFSSISSSSVIMYIKDVRPCSSNPSGQFQVYVNGFNLGHSTPIAQPTLMPTILTALLVASSNTDAVIESTHPYANYMNYYSSNIVFGSSPTGSITYRVQFDSSTQTESGYDYVRIRAGGPTGSV